MSSGVPRIALSAEPPATAGAESTAMLPGALFATAAAGVVSGFRASAFRASDLLSTTSQAATKKTRHATRVFSERCVEGIEADAAQCAHWLERSPALVTALAPKIGYAEAARLAKEALATGLTVRELVIQKKLLQGKELEEVLDLRAMTELGVPGGKGIPAGG